MSTSATDIVQSYTGNASTTVFTFPAKFLDNDHLKVYLDGVAQTSGFTVSGGGSASGGSVTFTSAPASGVEVVIVNEPPLTQLLDLTFNGKMPSTSLENAYDKLTMLCQLLDKRTDQSIKFPIYDTANLPTDLTLANRQGKLLGFDTSSNAQVELVSRAQATYQSGDRMVFASVSALTTEASITSVSSGDVVLLTGYYAAGDFGSPIELIVEASTGGVKSHTLNDGRYANLYPKGWADVRWLGAKVDGATDESSAWQAIQTAGYVGFASKGSHALNGTIANTPKIILDPEAVLVDLGAMSITEDLHRLAVVDDVENLGAGSVTETEIADAAVTADKIAPSAVTAAKIPDNSITSAKLKTDADGDKIAIANLNAAVQALINGSLDPTKYQGEWDPATNTPTIPAASTAGNWYYIPTGGTASGTNADGTYQDGDFVIDNGSSWLVRSAAPTNIPAGTVTESMLATAVQNKLWLEDTYDIFKILKDNMSFDRPNGKASVLVGDGNQALNNTRMVDTPIPVGGMLKEVRIYSSGAGTMKMKQISESGGNYTTEREYTVTVASGANTLVAGTDFPEYWLWEAGDYIGFYDASLSISYENIAGGAYKSFTGDLTGPATPTATTSARQLQVGWDIGELDDTTSDNVRDAINLLKLREIWNQGTQTVTDGPTTPATGTVGARGTTRVSGTAVSTSGVIDQIQIYAEVAGTIDIRVFTKSGSTFTYVRGVEVELAATGLQTLSLGKDFPGLTVTAGDYVGVYVNAEKKGTLSHLAAGGKSFWSVAADVTTSDTLTEASGSELQINWRVRYFDPITNLSTGQIPASKVADIGNGAKQFECIATATTLQFFLKGTGDNYIEYNFERDTDAPTSQDVWRLKDCYEVSRTAAYTYSRNFSGNDIVNAGAWECAIKVNGAADFVGTIHAYEELNDVFFFSNGIKITPSSAGNFTCEKLEIIQQSMIYEYGTTTDLVNRACNWEITRDGIRIRQTLDWRQSKTLDDAYLSMLSIRRLAGGAGSQVTDRGYTEDGWNEVDCTLSGFTLDQDIDARKILIMGTTSGISASVEVIKYGLEDRTYQLGYISNSATYNKIYFDHGNSATVATGDRWVVETKYKINTTNS